MFGGVTLGNFVYSPPKIRNNQNSFTLELILIGHIRWPSLVPLSANEDLCVVTHSSLNG